jgi:putative ABC transport system ATP-binding protein
VAIGRALANEPALILADEPTAALDTQRGTKVMATLREIARERRSTVIAVTHDHRMIDGFDTVYHLGDGRLTQVDHRPPAQDRLAPGTESGPITAATTRTQ